MLDIRTVTDTSGTLNTIRDPLSRQTPNLIYELQAKQERFFTIIQDKKAGVVPKQSMMHFQINEEVLTDLIYYIASVFNFIKHKTKEMLHCDVKVVLMFIVFIIV